MESMLNSLLSNPKKMLSSCRATADKKIMLSTFSIEFIFYIFYTMADGTQTSEPQVASLQTSQVTAPTSATKPAPNLKRVAAGKLTAAKTKKKKKAREAQIKGPYEATTVFFFKR